MSNAVVKPRRWAYPAPAPATMPPPLGDSLVARGVIDRDQLRIALHEQRNQGGLLGDVLCRLGFLHDDMLAIELADRAGLPFLAPEQLKADHAALTRLPQHLAQRYHALPVVSAEPGVAIALADPYDIVAQDRLRMLWPAPLRFVVAGRAALTEAIAHAYGPRGASADAVTALAPAAAADWLEQLLREAAELGASDVHFEPQQHAARVRVRLDGMLHQLKALHRDHWPALLQRLKIMAGVNIAETRTPQDGRFTLTLAAGAVLDCRVSFMPGVWGEGVALRLLDPRRAQATLSQLGFSAAQEETLRRLIARAEGLVLVTGPTGSGKSTTLNALLRHLDAGTRNIMTLEDPVEYRQEEIRQTQVREQFGLGFADGTRAMLRHDPDVILIGEIRDAASAAMALRVAMTGHLALSTLHTNDALGAIPRLLDLGVPRHVLASCLRGVVAQRLVRTLCPDCAPMHHGCPSCFGSGERGRIVVAEIMTITPDLDVLFDLHATPAQQRAALARVGFRSMWAEGRDRVAMGQLRDETLRAAVPETP